MRFSLLAPLGLLAATAHAWLPYERNLFDEQPRVDVAAGRGRTIKRYDPAFNKIRGVNLGSLFVVEQWMANQEWTTMGCDSVKAETDCVQLLTQQKANASAKFSTHWSSWITASDFAEMQGYGLNTVRIPLGYWIVESIVNNGTEHFPKGGLSYLDQIVGYAASKNMYVILDLHAAPKSQAVMQQFAGQLVSTTGFFTSTEYQRAYQWLDCITTRIHTNDAYRTVGMLEVLNEPEAGHGDLISTYYATALKTIRAAEARANVPASKALTVQAMAMSWGAGDPRPGFAGDVNVAYDNHRYLKWDSKVPTTRPGYLSASCNDNVAWDGNTPLVVGEWSLAVADSVQSTADFDTTTYKSWYAQWWAAQVLAYEKQMGWVFWSWKTQLGSDYRWGYRDAVKAGVIPSTFPSAAGLQQLAAC